MSEPTFLAIAVPRPSLADVLALTGAEVAAGVDLSVSLRGAASLDQAERGDLTFLDDPRRIDGLRETRASACFVTPRHRDDVPSSCLALVTESPARAFAHALAILFPRSAGPGSSFGTAGANPGAIIHPEARLEPGVIVDPGAVIGPRAEIGSGSIIGACSVIGPEVRIGRECAIGAQVVMFHVLLGNRVVLQPGVRLGQDGFAFADAPEGYVKIPHIGRVIVQDDAEIGANATVDRGLLRDTVIGEGAKVGSQVVIGGGVTIGRQCAIEGQAGLGSEAYIGDAARIGAMVRIDPRANVAPGTEVLAERTLRAFG